MLIRNAIATGLLATVATFAFSPAHAVDVAKHPQTGKNCVTFLSSQTTAAFQTRMNYRNICDNAFAIRIQTGDLVREKTIEAGSSEKPSTAYITCKADDRCEAAKWIFE